MKKKVKRKRKDKFINFTKIEIFFHESSRL